MTPAETLLAKLRVRSAELRMLTFQLDEVGIMLKSGHISPQGALYWAWANGVDLGDFEETTDTGRIAA